MITRTLNTEYYLRMMNRAELSPYDEVFFVADHAGVCTWIASKPHCNYNGWSEPGELYCKKCGYLFVGVPRDILRGNWCPSCSWCLYPASDPTWLDRMGYWLYRSRVVEFTRYAAEYFFELIPGNVYESHIDHIFSIRDGFEGGTLEFAVASPVNLRYISSGKNLRKGRQSDMAANELMKAYAAFVQEHPIWELIMKWADIEWSKDSAVTHGGDEKKALVKWLKRQGAQVFLGDSSP